MDNVPDQVINIGGEDNVVEQGGVVAADDGNQTAPQPNGESRILPQGMLPQKIFYTIRQII